MNSIEQDTQPTGEHIGDLKAASEAVEIAICLIPTLLGGLLWKMDVIGTTAMITGVAAIVGACYLAYKKLSGYWSVYDSGFALRGMGAPEETIRYEQVRSLTAQKTHHLQNDVYVGTKAEISIHAAKSELTLKTDYCHGSDKERTVVTLIDRCSEAIELRLLNELKQQGEVHWTKNIYLTSTGLKIADSNSQSREILFAAIDELKMQNNQLKIWRTGDALPILVMSNDESNFVPKFRLFYSLTAATHDLQAAASEIAETV